MEELHVWPGLEVARRVSRTQRPSQGIVTRTWPCNFGDQIITNSKAEELPEKHIAEGAGGRGYGGGSSHFRIASGASRYIVHSVCFYLEPLEEVNGRSATAVSLRAGRIKTGERTRWSEIEPEPTAYEVCSQTKV